MDNFNKTRIVTDIEWMSRHPDLLLVSYNKGEEANIGEQDGLVNVWATTLPTRPEYSLYCQSEVTKIINNPFRPNEVIGGTYAGYIVVWDIRAKSTPVLKSYLTSDSHSYPIYSLEVVGTENANNIVSISNDGRLCTWQMEMFTSPQKSFELKHHGKEVCVICMAFPQDESNDFYVGAEDNSLYFAQVHNMTEITKDNTGTINSLPGHCAPVTSLSLHPTPVTWSKGRDYSHLMLSCSMDWSIKLWNPKVGTLPLTTFESGQDYVFDVKWSPVHPSLFASCDAEGFIDLWDINADLENPIAHKRRDNSIVHKLAWSFDGKRLAAGGANGVVNVYNIEDKVS
jgi:dynein intermediate chain